MQRNRFGRHRRAAGRGDLRQPPGEAGVPSLEEEVVVAPGGIIRGTGVFEEDEARHGGVIADGKKVPATDSGPLGGHRTGSYT
jgi:hypothetical protein